MVDWIFEVLQAFKMSEQTFFLSVQYMDRYVASVPNRLPLEQLHIVGITCMFIASKYEDITPLFMPTVTKRIGHNRFTKDAILKQERHILSTLSFKMASVPTVLEFLERYLMDEYWVGHPGGGVDTLRLLSKYLAFLSCHHI